MSNQVTVHNTETGEIYVRDKTQEELDLDKKIAADIAADKERAILRDAVIAKLGLTADEVQALLN